MVKTKKSKRLRKHIACIDDIRPKCRKRGAVDVGFFVECGDGRIYLVVFDRVEEIEVYGVVFSYQHAVSFAVVIELHFLVEF